MEIDARVEAWASLQLLPGVSARVLAGMLKALGGPEEVRGASRSSLAKLVPSEVAAAIERGPEPALLERTLTWIAEPGHALVAWDDAEDALRSPLICCAAARGSARRARLAARDTCRTCPPVASLISLGVTP